MAIEPGRDEAARRAVAAPEAARVHVSRRGSALRVAPHRHDSREDVERLLAAVRSAL